MTKTPWEKWSRGSSTRKILKQKTENTGRKTPRQTEAPSRPGKETLLKNGIRVLIENKAKLSQKEKALSHQGTRRGKRRLAESSTSPSDVGVLVSSRKGAWGGEKLNCDAQWFPDKHYQEQASSPS